MCVAIILVGRVDQAGCVDRFGLMFVKIRVFERLRTKESLWPVIITKMTQCYDRIHSNIGNATRGTILSSGNISFLIFVKRIKTDVEKRVNKYY